MLVLAPTRQRLESAVSWFRQFEVALCDLETDRPQAAQIIVGTLKQARKDLRYLGVIDFLIVDDCANMSPIVGSKRFDEISDTLTTRNRSLRTIVYDRKAILRLPEFELPMWRCGQDPLIAKLPTRSVHVAHGDIVACGASNKQEHYFCRTCGRFRGFCR